MKVWYLEGYVGRRRNMQRIRLSSFPFQVGRQGGLDLVLDSESVSRVHAEIDAQEEVIRVRDLGSTNGTYVNRERVQDGASVHSGDIIHFGDEEFRLFADERATSFHRKVTHPAMSPLPDKLPTGTREFQELLRDGRIRAEYQPIVARADGERHGWEILGRGTHPELSESPGVLFRIAESLGLEVELSELMRRTGIEEAYRVARSATCFTNIHPAEMVDPGRLLQGVEQLCHDHESARLVVEIHEAAVADQDVLRRFNKQVHERNGLIAYDDFGRGQARLVELADVPPDYVKLDMDLIRDIDHASLPRRRMVRMLTEFARDHGILVIAEGPNSDEEVQFCEELKVDFFQSFRFGKPGPLSP